MKGPICRALFMFLKCAIKHIRHTLSLVLGLCSALSTPLCGKAAHLWGWRHRNYSPMGHAQPSGNTCRG